MVISITQARPLLTAAELELFDSSRAEPIRAFALTPLKGLVRRARTLRDKYRDLYQRQTVAARAASVHTRLSGSDNARTQRKAQIFEEVLGRFEARVELLERRAQKESDRSAKQRAAQMRVAESATQAAKTRRATARSSPGARSDKAPSRKAPTFGGKAHAPQINAPIDMVPAARRANPLRNNPSTVAIHGHQSASVRRAQGKRDSR